MYLFHTQAKHMIRLSYSNKTGVSTAKIYVSKGWPPYLNKKFKQLYISTRNFCGATKSSKTNQRRVERINGFHRPPAIATTTLGGEIYPKMHALDKDTPVHNVATFGLLKFQAVFPTRKKSKNFPTP